MIAKPNPSSRSMSSTYHLATIRPSHESKGSSSSALATINNNNQDLIIISALVTEGRLLTTKSSTPYDELAETCRSTDRPISPPVLQPLEYKYHWTEYIYIYLPTHIPSPDYNNKVQLIYQVRTVYTTNQTKPNQTQIKINDQFLSLKSKPIQSQSLTPKSPYPPS